MANNPSTLPGYNGQTNAPDANYPYGSARDDLAPGDLTGTPRIASEINDIMGFQQALLNQAGIVPSGSPDTVVTSQYLDAVKEVARLAMVPDLSQAYTFKTVELMQSSTIIFPVGKKIFWQGYYAESDGGSNWGIVKSGAHVDDGGSVFTLDNGDYVAANIKGKLVSVKKFGTPADGVTPDQDFINNALATGISIRLPEATVSYYITGPLTPLIRYQSIEGSSLLAELIVETTVSDFDAITISSDNMLKNLRIQGTGTTKGTGIKISAGTLADNFAATCTVKNCWTRTFKNGIEFDNAFHIKFYNSQFRQCAVGVRMTPVPTDDANAGYLANINFYGCRWNGNTVNDVLQVAFATSLSRGISFFGCDLDPMAGSATESLNFTNAALVKIVGCYLEPDTSGASGRKILKSVGSVFVSLDTCLFSNTGGFDIESTQLDINNCWSFSAVSPDDSDPIIADANSIVTIENSTLRSTAHNFLGAARVTLIDATIRVGGNITYFVNTTYKNGVISHEEGDFVPTYEAASGAFTTLTYDIGNTKGRYIKNGNKVYVTGVIRTTEVSLGTASGNLTIKLNIPFVSATQVYRSVISISEVGISGIFGGESPLSATVGATSDVMQLFYRTTSPTGDLKSQVNDLSIDVAARNFLCFTGEFTVDPP